jgi:hypothetical protein
VYSRSNRRLRGGEHSTSKVPILLVLHIKLNHSHTLWSTVRFGKLTVRPGSQIPRFLRNMKVYYRVHNNPPSVKLFRDPLHSTLQTCVVITITKLISKYIIYDSITRITGKCHNYSIRIMNRFFGHNVCV